MLYKINNFFSFSVQNKDKRLLPKKKGYRAQNDITSNIFNDALKAKHLNGKTTHLK